LKKHRNGQNPLARRFISEGTEENCGVESGIPGVLGGNSPPSPPLGNFAVSSQGRRGGGPGARRHKWPLHPLAPERPTTRTNRVWVGIPMPGWYYCGEGRPVPDEDRLGDVRGSGGQVLTDIHRQRDEDGGRETCTILNILACRPPGNPQSLPIEAPIAVKYLDHHWRSYQPELFVVWACAREPIRIRARRRQRILRAEFTTFTGSRSSCTYHLGISLRYPVTKRLVWDTSTG